MRWIKDIIYLCKLIIFLWLFLTYRPSRVLGQLHASTGVLSQFHAPAGVLSQLHASSRVLTDIFTRQLAHLSTTFFYLSTLSGRSYVAMETGDPYVMRHKKNDDDRSTRSSADFDSHSRQAVLPFVGL